MRCIFTLHSASWAIPATTGSPNLLQRLYDDAQLVAWASVCATLAVVFVAIFLNLTLQGYRRPCFRITCGVDPSFQKAVPAADDPDVRQLHTRLRVHNIGRTQDEACEVRLEQIYRVFSGRPTRTEIVPRHDPRPLKWVGRSPDPIALARGAFDFVDLGVRRADFLDNLTIEFGPRGRLDLNLDDENIQAFRINGTVYGKHAKPCPFQFELVWNIVGELEPIQIREV